MLSAWTVGSGRPLFVRIFKQKEIGHWACKKGHNDVPSGK
jgi:hypothetical protein